MGDALDWLSTAAASGTARRTLQGQRLSTSLADDVLQEARLRVWRLEERHAEAPDAPEAVARRAIHRAVGDLSRRRFRRPVEEHWDFDDPIGVADAPPGSDEDDTRRAVIAAKTAASMRAAALAKITFAFHPDVPVPLAAPQPADGGDDQRTDWAALWLAGERCFPPDDPAVRKRRSRAIATLRLLLGQAAEVADA